MIELGPDTVIPERPFTSMERTEEDVAILSRMLDRLRIHVRDVVRTRIRAKGMEPVDDRPVDADGSRHTIILPDPDRLLDREDLAVVAFFGQARVDVDHAAIVDLEQALIADMTGSASPLAYHNVFWPGVGWGNLVLFADAATKDAWGHQDPRHREAVARSPRHYHSIRLHHGVLRHGLAGSEPIILVRTKYIDYASDPAWRAMRRLSGPRA